MKFLIISESGDGIGIAQRLKEEGNQVSVWIRDDEASKRGDFIVDKIHRWNFSVDDSTVVVADCTGSGVLCDALRRGGQPVIGGSLIADRLEADRSFATQVMNEAGVNTPQSKSFDNWDEAITFASEHEEQLVFKPEGDLSGVVSSVVSHDREELIELLQAAKAKGFKQKPEFTLQEFIEGTCVSTECWFDGYDFVDEMTNHTLERKQFMNDDLGPSGGCTGNVVWACSGCEICDATVYKLKSFLRHSEYIGPIDVNAVVSKEGIYALEFTPRFGYDATPTLLFELLDGDIGELLSAKRGRLRTGFAAGVKLSIPPWPSEEHHAEVGIPIRGINRSGDEHFYIYDVMEDYETKKLCSSGGYGILGVALGYGDNIGEAFANAYQFCKRLRVPNLQYRTDLTSVFQRDFRALSNLLNGKRDTSWIGVDLDGTLAHYDGYEREIGTPIELMVQRVKRWLGSGKEVRIVTARVAPREEQHEQAVLIHEWIKRHIGQPLEVTSHKEHDMKVLYDDRVKQVEPNTGKLVGG